MLKKTLKITLQNETQIATFVAPDGTICKSEIMHDWANEYDYVADGKGETWLLNQVHIIKVENITQTEILELEELEELDWD